MRTGLLIALILLACTQQPEFVSDPAGFLTPTEKKRISELCDLLLDEIDIHFFLAVLPDSMHSIEQQAVAFFNHQQLGRKTSGERGMLFLVNPVQKKVKLEVGYDLEYLFPDAFTGEIEDHQMVPFFQQKKISTGIEATVELLVSRAFERDTIRHESRRWAEFYNEHLSGGAGAIRRMDHTIKSDSAVVDTSCNHPQATPLKALQCYRHAMETRRFNANAGFITPASRSFLKNRVITPAQMDNAAKVLAQHWDRAEVYADSQHAVIRFPIDCRQANPYFVFKDADGWMIDLYAMHRDIGFNHLNQWHLKSSISDYLFGFYDWSFDQNGFPYLKKDS